MKHILAATDFSKPSKHAVNCAARLALDTGTRLTLFHSTHIPVLSDSFFDLGMTLEALEESNKANMKMLVDELKKKYTGLNVEGLVKVGFTGETLKKMTRDGAIGLVVMGITHLDGFSQAMFGSTSTNVAGQLNCPVLIVPEKWRYRPFTKMTFAFDQQEIPLAPGLKSLADLKTTFGASLSFVNVLDENYPVKDAKVIKKVTQVLGIDTPKIHWLQPIKYELVNQLRDFTKRYKSNLLVMISRQHTALWKLFNERRTKKMAFETHIPLLIISEKKS